LAVWTQETIGGGMPAAPRKQAKPQLQVGDHAPVFSCSDVAGELFEFYVAVEGKPIVLLFCGDNDLEKLSKSALSTLSIDHDKVQAVALAAGAAAQVKARVPEQDWPYRTLVDPGSEITSGIAALSGVDAPSVYVLDPNQRIVGIAGLEEDDDLQSWLDDCLEEASHDNPPETVATIPPVLVVPRVLEPEDCEWLIGLWRDGEKHAGQVAHGAASADRKGVAQDIKRREDYVLTEPEYQQRVLNRVMPRLVPELKKIFHFHRFQMEALRVGCYKATDKGFFDVHRDNCNPSVADRKYAITINLNTGEYEGGDLRFPEYGNELFAPPAGGAIVFSCSMLHEVLPVTKGERFVLLTFLTQPAQ